MRSGRPCLGRGRMAHGRGMRVLCVETEPGLASDAVEQLQAAGHEVVRCFDEIVGPARPCAGLECPGSCPLETGPGVDVVLDVRGGDQALPAGGEVGVTCALREQVPLAVAGRIHPNPFARWTDAVVDAGAVVAGCEAARQRSLDDLGARVSIWVCQLLDGYNVPGIDVTTDVQRRGRDLQIVIHRPATERSRDVAIAVNVHRRLRNGGVPASTISISCTD
jgi:hypothetical protein